MTTVFNNIWKWEREYQNKHNIQTAYYLKKTRLHATLNKQPTRSQFTVHNFGNRNILILFNKGIAKKSKFKEYLQSRFKSQRKRIELLSNSKIKMSCFKCFIMDYRNTLCYWYVPDRKLVLQKTQLYICIQY